MRVASPAPRRVRRELSLQVHKHTDEECWLRYQVGLALNKYGTMVLSDLVLLYNGCMNALSLISMRFLIDGPSGKVLLDF